MRRLTICLVIFALGGTVLAQEKKAKGLQLTDLPAAVQKTVQANLKGGEIKTSRRRRRTELISTKSRHCSTGKREIST